MEEQLTESFRNSSDITTILKQLLLRTELHATNCETYTTQGEKPGIDIHQMSSWSIELMRSRSHVSKARTLQGKPAAPTGGVGGWGLRGNKSDHEADHQFWGDPGRPRRPEWAYVTWKIPASIHFTFKSHANFSFWAQKRPQVRYAHSFVEKSMWNWPDFWWSTSAIPNLGLAAYFYCL